MRAFCVTPEVAMTMKVMRWRSRVQVPPTVLMFTPSASQIAALPATIGTLTALASLTLQSNHLEVLPKAVSKLVNLVDLVVRSESLSRFHSPTTPPRNHRSPFAPPHPRLPVPQVDDNELGTFPGVLANCTALEWISATSNLLTGIPTVVLKLPSLTWLDARNNHIESVPKKMSTLTNLRSLTLELNPLSLAKPDVFRAMADAGSLSCLPVCLSVYLVGWLVGWGCGVGMRGWGVEWGGLGR